MFFSNSSVRIARILVVAPVFCAPAAGQTPLSQTLLSQSLPPVVVSATRLPTRTEEVASSVTVITGDDIERRQRRNLADVLRDVPGLNLVQTGGPGGTTSVFMRGTNANHTKVLVDGMPVNNPADYNGAFDFGPYLIGDIARIEVLRGSQSGLYGSDAIGGVIAITTKKGAGPLMATGSLEAGSFRTFNQSASVSGSEDRVDYSVALAHSRVAATPVTPKSLLPAGRSRIDDDYEITTLATRFGAALSDAVGVSLTTRYAYSDLRFTGDDVSVSPSVPDANQSSQLNRQFITRGEATWALFDGRFEQRFGLGYLQDRGRSQDEPTNGVPAEPSFIVGDRIRADWLGTLHVAKGQTVLWGLEQEREAIHDSPTSAQNDNRAGFLEVQTQAFDRLYASAVARHDDNERFGGVTTYRFAPAFLLRETDTKLKASYGTGYKAPSLNQLFVSYPAFGFFANPNLQPERSRGWDAGFEQTLGETGVAFGTTYFHTDIDNLIVTNAAGTSVENRPEARLHGYESFVGWTPNWWGDDRLRLRLDHTYTIARDGRTHATLLRRPKDKFGATAQWRALDDLSLSAGVLRVGSRYDGDRDFSIQRQGAKGYTLVNVAASYDVAEQVAVFSRLDNALDARYQDPTGFQRPGFGAYLGVKVSFGGEPPRPDKAGSDK